MWKHGVPFAYTLAMDNQELLAELERLRAENARLRQRPAASGLHDVARHAQMLKSQYGREDYPVDENIQETASEAALLLMRDMGLA